METITDGRMVFCSRPAVEAAVPRGERAIGRTRSRKEKHWKGEWGEEMHNLTSVKNWKRRLGLCHKEEKRAIKRRKRQLRRERKRTRREKLSRLRTRDPRKYWRQIQDLMGKPKGDAPTGCATRGSSWNMRRPSKHGLTCS